MTTRFTVLLVLAAFFMAGCLGGADPAEDPKPKTIQAERVKLNDYLDKQQLYSLGEIKPFVATAKDGLKLKGHVYVPEGDGPWPTVLEYSPYWNQPERGSDGHSQIVDGRRTMIGNHRHLMDRGFAVALINIRGTGISQGCFQWGAPQDLEDAHLVIETLASQPWSNGNVGMIGLSYPGWTQYMAISAQPPSLKAVVPVSGVIDLHSLLTRNGAPLNAGPAVTTIWNTLYSLREATYPPLDSRGGEANHLECGPRYAEDIREGMALVYSGDRNAYWAARDLRPKIAQSHIPIFFTNGMTTGEGHILQFEGLWDLIPAAEKRMLVGQWPHAYPQAPPEDFWPMVVLWFEHYLRGGPKLVSTGVVDYQDDSKAWHASDQWPPAHTPVTLPMSDRSLVVASENVRASTQTFQSVFKNPDFSDCGPVQAMYVSPPLKSDVLLAGNFFVNLTVTSTQPDGNLAAFLYRTTGNGGCPDSAAKEIRRALTDLRHPLPDHRGADFPLNMPTPVTIRSHPFATPLKAGERLVLIVGGESTELTPEPRKPVLTISTGPNLQGSLTLPVVEGTLEFN